MRQLSEYKPYIAYKVIMSLGISFINEVFNA